MLFSFSYSIHTLTPVNIKYPKYISTGNLQRDLFYGKDSQLILDYCAEAEIFGTIEQVLLGAPKWMLSELKNH